MHARIAYVTAGTIGAGHLVRAVAISRALSRAGFRGELVVVGPPAPHVFGLDHRAVRMVPRELGDAARAERSELHRVLSELQPDLVLVDLFWAPLVHVLPALRAPAWLLVRRVPQVWFEGPPGLPFSRARYERVIAIEPGVVAPADECIEPVIAVNPDELLGREALRERLDVRPDEKLVVVAHAGAPGECSVIATGEVARDPSAKIHVFAFDRPHIPGAEVHDGADVFPLASWLAGADAIVTGAGYNTFWEAQWLGHSARTRFVAFERPIDDQAWRLSTCRTHVPRDNGADVLARRIVSG
jgi:UDP:flavonoid glycosyltransferase YjiC (YdhE family)